MLCAGRGADAPPSDDAGFLEWIRTLPTTDVFDGEPLLLAGRGKAGGMRRMTPFFFRFGNL